MASEIRINIGWCIRGTTDITPDVLRLHFSDCPETDTVEDWETWLEDQYPGDGEILELIDWQDALASSDDPGELEEVSIYRK